MLGLSRLRAWFRQGGRDQAGALGNRGQTLNATSPPRSSARRPRDLLVITHGLSGAAIFRHRELVCGGGVAGALRPRAQRARAQASALSGSAVAGLSRARRHLRTYAGWAAATLAAQRPTAAVVRHFSSRGGGWQFRNCRVNAALFLFSLSLGPRIFAATSAPRPRRATSSVPICRARAQLRTTQ